MSICTDGGSEEVGGCNGGRFKEVDGCIDGGFEEVRVVLMVGLKK